MAPRSLAFLLAVAGIPAVAATVSIPNQAGHTGDSIVAPLRFSSRGQLVSGLQFDLTWDPPLAIEVAIGEEIGQFAKILYTAMPAPNRLRCLITGVNQNVLSDGTLVRLFIRLNADAPQGTAQITVTNTSAVTPDGTAVALDAASASVEIQSGDPSTIISPSGILNAASLLAGFVAPGEVITLLGSLPVSSEVRFNGISAPITYAGEGQLNAMVPFELDLSRSADLQVSSRGQQLARLSVPVAPVEPAIFTQNFTGIGPGAILNQDYTVNSDSNPAAPGSIVMVYGTGFGLLDGPAADGQAAAGTVLLESVVTATVGGRPAEVTYAGTAPGLISGVAQINVRIPPDAPHDLFAPISLSIGSASTPPGVTVAVQ